MFCCSTWRAGCVDNATRRRRRVAQSERGDDTRQLRHLRRPEQVLGDGRHRRLPDRNSHQDGA